MRSVTSRQPRALVAVALVVALLPAGIAVAQEGPFPNDVTLTPESDQATAGTCNEFTARVTGFGEGPVPISGVTVDVLQTLTAPGNEPAETRELAFCNPQNAAGANPTGQGGTAFGDVTGNNPGETAGQPGRNTAVHAEVGPTNANGEVTFGITMTPESTSGSVTVLAWFDFEDEDDDAGGDEPNDDSTKTWNAVEQPAVTSLDADPETSSNPNGSQHSVTVTVLDDGTPVSGVVPQSVILSDGTGAAAGDVADPASGVSPNFTSGSANPAAYPCTASNANGVSTCTFQDPLASGAGTDTILFFVDLGGVAGEPDAGEPQDAVQKTWVVPGGGPNPPPPGPSAPEARNIQLCHGPSPSPQCDTSPQILDVGDEHAMSVLVTNRAGAPLPGIPVQLRHVGPADFVSTGTDVVMVVTGPDGTARAILHSEREGTSSIVAEISPPGTAGSFRGPGAADDECEQPEGPGGAPRTGNCTSASLTAVWTQSATPPRCEDGVDNDADGYVDYPDDPGCTDENDDSEDPVDEPPPPDQQHPRRINMRFRDWVGPGDEGLVIFGRLRLVDEDDNFRKCTQGQPVAIQRKVDGEYETVKRATTNARGRYAGVVFDKPGPYRAVARATRIVTDDGATHTCLRAQKAKTHHHRR